jgi:hypothetical protein
MSPPQWRPRCPFEGRGGKAGLLQAVPSEARTPEARSCTNAVRKQAALTEPRAAAEPGTKRGRFAGGVQFTKAENDGLKQVTDGHTYVKRLQSRQLQCIAPSASAILLRQQSRVVSVSLD